MLIISQFYFKKIHQSINKKRREGVIPISLNLITLPHTPVQQVAVYSFQVTECDPPLNRRSVIMAGCMKTINCLISISAKLMVFMVLLVFLPQASHQNTGKKVCPATTDISLFNTYIKRLSLLELTLPSLCLVVESVATRKLASQMWGTAPDSVSEQGRNSAIYLNSFCCKCTKLKP